MNFEEESFIAKICLLFIRNQLYLGFQKLLHDVCSLFEHQCFFSSLLQTIRFKHRLFDTRRP